MKKLKTSIILAALLALSPGCAQKITGHWDPDLPGHFEASNPLYPDEAYLILNATHETIYVWLLDGRTPLNYFPVMPGEFQRLISPGDVFDLHLYAGGDTEPTVNGISLWWLPN